MNKPAEDHREQLYQVVLRKRRAFRHPQCNRFLKKINKKVKPTFAKHQIYQIHISEDNALLR